MKVHALAISTVLICHTNCCFCCLSSTHLISMIFITQFTNHLCIYTYIHITKKKKNRLLTHEKWTIEKPSIWFDSRLTMNSWRFKQYANVFFHSHAFYKCNECGLEPMAIYFNILFIFIFKWKFQKWWTN